MVVLETGTAPALRDAEGIERLLFHPLGGRVFREYHYASVPVSEFGAPATSVGEVG